MSEPTLSSFIIRVGGVGVVFAIAILITNEYFPGYSGYVVIAISGLGICFLAAKEIFKKNNQAKKKGRTGGKAK